MRALALSLAVLVLVAPAHAAPSLKRTRLLEVELAGTPEQTLVAPSVRRGVGWALVPFGIGQFANGQPVKGTVFCVSELALLLTAGTALGAFEASKVSGTFMQGGDFRDTGQAKTLEVVYLAAFWAGVALMAVGVVEALVVRLTPQTTLAVDLGPGAVTAKF